MANFLKLGLSKSTCETLNDLGFEQPTPVQEKAIPMLLENDPSDFIGLAQSQNPMGDHHQKLMANFFAQTEALMKGKTEEQVIDEFEKAGKSEEEIEKLIPSKYSKGINPRTPY